MNVLIQECQRDAFSLDASFQVTFQSCAKVSHLTTLQNNLTEILTIPFRKNPQSAHFYGIFTLLTQLKVIHTNSLKLINYDATCKSIRWKN
jgi:hypothetical protein